MTLSVKEPLTEIVWYVLDLKAHCTSLMELRSLVPVNELWGLATEELEDLVSVLTIHFDFVEHWKLYSPLVDRVFFNLLLIPRFKILSKLIARKGQYLESVFLVFVIELT